jgi:hypothetical protein
MTFSKEVLMAWRLCHRIPEFSASWSFFPEPVILDVDLEFVLPVPELYQPSSRGGGQPGKKKRR